MKRLDGTLGMDWGDIDMDLRPVRQNQKCDAEPGLDIVPYNVAACKRKTGSKTGFSAIE